MFLEEIIVTIETLNEPTPRVVNVAGLDINIRESGEGKPLVILHRSTGYLEWDSFANKLSESFHVIYPDLPGFGNSERPDWARESRDLSIVMVELFKVLDIKDITLVGLGLGGFIAAELATMNQERLSSIVLISPAGIKPDEGEILDQMLIEHADYIRHGLADPSHFENKFGDEVHPDIQDIWEFSRIMTARISWSPYMFNRRLPHLLNIITVPTLIIFGNSDTVIPYTVGQQFINNLSNGQLKVIDGGGHLIEWEMPDKISELIVGHSS